MSRVMGLRLRSAGRLVCLCCGSDKPVLEVAAAGGRIITDTDNLRACICSDCFDTIGLRYPSLSTGYFDASGGLRS